MKITEISVSILNNTFVALIYLKKKLLIVLSPVAIQIQNSQLVKKNVRRASLDNTAFLFREQLN